MIRCVLCVLISMELSLALENLALKKFAWQDSNYNSLWTADKAVDGQFSTRISHGGQCAISGINRRTATWGVDLGDIVSISHINIHYRTDDLPSPTLYVSRMAGFFLFVSNTTSKDDGYLCFHEIQNVSGTPLEDQNINCSIYGRYVIYYNERKPDVDYPNYYSQYAFNELCEVEVYGCSVHGYYGYNCDMRCPEHCQEDRCDIHSGACLGCIPGYQSPHCNQVCTRQRYGHECSQSCGSCKNREACHHVNGSCLSGCDGGFEGDRCLRGCEFGYYGNNCQFTCAEHCRFINRCSRAEGVCDGGCVPGWAPPRCDQECDSGKYGVNCSQQCGSCLDNEPCHHINGTCPNGCSSGYFGPWCSEVCEDTFWGLGCKNRCSIACDGRKCRHDSGKCYSLKQTDGLVVYVVVVVTVGVFVVGIIIVSITVALLRRKKSAKENEETARDMDYINNDEPRMEIDYSNLSTETSTSEHGGVNEYNYSDAYNDTSIHAVTMQDIHLNELDDIIREKQKDEDKGFRRDHESVPYGETRTCEDAKRPENIAKNRYDSCLPYDDTRVKLMRRWGHGDYINASVIPGFQANDLYIATQGPQQNTVSHFWAMVWQEKVSHIVMLTNLKEGEKVKCNQYWPDMQQSLFYDPLSVRTTDENCYATYYFRKFMITYKKLNEKRIVTQFQYFAWADRGLPEPLCLAVFHSHVRRTLDVENVGPTLVHCSNGIGRTGTYIAIDALYKAGKMEKKINVTEYVTKMRKSRMNMVQTHEQYMIILRTLNELFKMNPVVETKPEFVKRAGSMNTTELREEFKTLQRIRPSYTEAEYISISRGDSHMAVRLLKKYRVRSPAGCNDVINAITLSSYVKQDSFIVTQYPAPDDAVSFLRMLTEYKSDTVICMDRLKDLKFSSEWLPHHKPKYLNQFTVHRQNKSVTDVKRTTLHIVINGSNDEVSSVEVVEPKFRIQSTDQFSTSLHDLVSYVLRSQSTGPVTVVNKDGAVRCGVFCAVHNVVQQFRIDGQIDIPSVVRLLHVRGPELCSNLDEYNMVYTAVLDFVRQNDNEMYANL